MALPKPVFLSRVLRRHRQMKASVGRNGDALPSQPKDMNFTIPAKYQEFVLHDSGPGTERVLVFGNSTLLSFIFNISLIVDCFYKCV